ncbi:MAG: Maf family protein [Oscillospiraceae bacterium]|nr:Maf family protein [Oscillospiraceae bacterium]
MKIVLASASPRRKELMRLVADEFEIRPSDADETLPEGIQPEKAAEYLSDLKAHAAEYREDEIIIGCDTVVVIDNTILGKPRTSQECFEMLSMLSGKTHRVYTGVTFRGFGKSFSFTEETAVEFYALTDEEILEYIKTGEPFDKAGGYGIQGKGAMLVKGIKGDYFNVVGLPASRLKRELEVFMRFCIDK